MSSSDGMLKIFFEPTGNPEEDWHDTVEYLWATPLEQLDAPGGRVFRLENSPWYAYGVSYLDDVCAEPRSQTFPEGDDEVSYANLYFTNVWKHNGHSTYLVFLAKGITTDSTEWLLYWDRLKGLGCTWEGMSGRLLAIDVAPGNDLDAIEAILEEAQTAECFEYQIQHRYLPPRPLA